MKNTSRNKEVRVRDRAAEIGINLNTIFTALMLAVMLWVGTNIENIREKVAQYATAIAVMQLELRQIRDEFTNHVNDHRKK
jgi:hypothetical protein